MVFEKRAISCARLHCFASQLRFLGRAKAKLSENADLQLKYQNYDFLIQLVELVCDFSFLLSSVE